MKHLSAFSVINLLKNEYFDYNDNDLIVMQMTAHERAQKKYNCQFTFRKINEQKQNLNEEWRNDERIMQSLIFELHCPFLISK